MLPRHDSKLKRDAAIIVLPKALARDADRRSCFRREGELLASLNHLSSATKYGLERTISRFDDGEAR